MKRTYKIYPVFGGGYEVWDVVDYRREVCFGIFGTKAAAKRWAEENLTQERKGS